MSNAFSTLVHTANVPHLSNRKQNWCYSEAFVRADDILSLHVSCMMQLDKKPNRTCSHSSSSPVNHSQSAIMPRELGIEWNWRLARMPRT